MKTLLLTLILACLSLSSFGQSDAIFNEFKREKNAEYISIPPVLMTIGNWFTGKDADAEFARKVKSVKILDMEHCSKRVKQRFDQRVDALQHKRYETMVRINDEGERMRIYIRVEKGIVHELLIACSEHNECTLVQINGRFKREDINQLIEANDPRNHEHP